MDRITDIDMDTGLAEVASGSTTPRPPQPTAIPERNRVTADDEKRVEQQIVLLYWTKMLTIKLKLKESELATQLTHPDRTHREILQPIEPHAVGFIYMIRMKEWSKTEKRPVTYILTSGLVNPKFMGLQTPFWARDPRTGNNYRIDNWHTVEGESGIHILECWSWPHATLPNLLVHLSVQRRDDETELRYLGISHDRKQVWKGTASLDVGDIIKIKGDTMSWPKSTILLKCDERNRPSNVVGAPVMTSLGNVCAIVVQAPKGGNLIIFELRYMYLLQMEYIFEDAYERKLGSPPVDRPARSFQRQWYLEGARNGLEFDEV